MTPTLYYLPGACSLAPHIVARELGLAVALSRVGRSDKRTEDGRAFDDINPKGYVPALEIEPGVVLTEGPVISQYLADQVPGNALLPAYGTRARYRVLEWLGYINSELHKSYSPLFDPAAGEDVKTQRRAYLARRYGLVETQLAQTPYLIGEAPTIADMYLFVVTNWAGRVGVDLGAFPALQAFQQRIAARPAVQAALAAEGLLQAKAA